MNNIVEELKLVILENLPDKKEKLLWIINHLTTILEIPQKEEVQFFQDIVEEYPEMIYHLTNMIEKLNISKQNKQILFHYTLEQSLIKLMSYLTI